MNENAKMVQCCQSCTFRNMIDCEAISSNRDQQHRALLVQNNELIAIRDIVSLAKSIREKYSLNYTEFNKLANFIIDPQSPTAHHFEAFLQGRLRYSGSYKKAVLLEKIVINKNTNEIRKLAALIKSKTPLCRYEELREYFQNTGGFFFNMKGGNTEIRRMDRIGIGYGGEYFDMYIPCMSEYLIRDILASRVRKAIENVKEDEPAMQTSNATGDASLDEMSVTDFFPITMPNVDLNRIMSELDAEGAFDDIDLSIDVDT